MRPTRPFHSVIAALAAVPAGSLVQSTIAGDQQSPPRIAAVEPSTSAASPSSRSAKAARVPEAVRDGDLVEVRPERDPTSRTYFANGMNADAQRAVELAEALAERLASGLTLAFVDCSEFHRDFIAIATTKTGDFDTELNPAADALVSRVLKDLRQGRTVRLVGYSLGGALIQNVVNEVEERLRANERERSLVSIHVLLLGAAVFSADHPLSDGWPAGVRVFAVSDIRDPVARVWGDVDDDWLESQDARHSLEEVYLPHVRDELIGRHGRMVIDGDRLLLEEVRLAADPAERVVRWRVWSIPDEGSRRSINASIPPDWDVLRWGVEEHPEGQRVRFDLVEDVAFWPDDAVLAGCQDGIVTKGARGDYIGRVAGAGVDDEFFITARPQ